MTSPLADWLKKNELESWLPLFDENEVDLKTLEVLTEADLKELGLPFGPRKRILNALAESKRPATVRQTVGKITSSFSSGERRQLTVMFCDLVGSTKLSTILDPEELHALIGSYRNTCCDVVARYEGHVAQYLGDGLMIYFGWPVAHEDAAERGVRSALEIVAAVKALPAAQRLAVRIGVATGAVVVGDTSRNGNAEARLAVGETPNLAARVQAEAGPDEVLIAPATRRLIADAFLLTDLGAHSLKGMAHAVQLWRVDEARRSDGRFKAARNDAGVAPLVGRDDESQFLERLWKQALKGAGQAVLVGGQPGIGKSHLIQRLRENMAEPREVRSYQCSPYHLHSPLHPFIAQLELSSGFGRDDSVEQRLEKLEATLLGDDGQKADAAPLYAALLSLPTDRYAPLNLSPRKQKEKTLEAVITQVEVLAREKPLLLVVEDVHWIDPTSNELIELLIPKVAGLRILLVMTGRPEAIPAWEGRSGVTSLTLHRLDPDHGARLVDVVTGGKALPPEVLAEIVARTDGVPLFVHELTRSVIESGVLRDEGGHYSLQGSLQALAIPASLRDSLMARLDRLGPVKELAQIGACIGREFSFELLERVSDLRVEPLASSLETLAESGLVSRSGSPPDATYVFKHALVQDAAYDSLLKTTRSELHGRIAEVIEHIYADRVEKTPEWLAHHLTQAGLLAKAIPLWRKAGTIAVSRVAMKEAVAHFQKGLSLTAQLPASEQRDDLELSIRQPLNAAWTGLRGWAAPEVGENAAAILRLAESRDNPEGLLLALWWVWTNTITQGRIADSLEWVERLMKAGLDRQDADLQIFGHVTAMVHHFLNGRLKESRAEVDQVFTLYDSGRADRWIQLTGHEMRTFVEVYACQLFWMLGFPDQAAKLSAAARADAQADGHAFNLVWALTFSAYVHAYRREPKQFMEQVGEADYLAREQGLAFIYEVSVPQARGVAELERGRPREAITFLRQGIERWTKTGGNVRVPFLKSVLAEALARDGDAAAGLQVIDECIEQIERPSGQERLWLAEVLRIKGSILLRMGRDEEGEAQLRASIACAREQEARSWELRGTTALASFLAARGRQKDARELLAPICEWFTEGVGTKDLIEARDLLGKLAS